MFSFLYYFVHKHITNLKIEVMKKNKLNMVVAIALCVSLGLSSCIGSFKLTNKVLGWNEGVGNKFVNELVFIAFHIIPVYELTVVADILVLNSIDFWSGENLVSQSTKEVKGENGDTYLVTTDENGYTITNQKDNTTIGFVFDSNDNSWSVSANGETTKFMTFVDDNHVKMPGVDGNDMIIELSQTGVMAYQEAAQHFNFAMK